MWGEIQWLLVLAPYEWMEGRSGDRADSTHIDSRISCDYGGWLDDL